MKNELKKIIQELKEVIKEENLNIIDRDILDFALRLFNTNQINDSKKPFKSGGVFSGKDMVNALDNKSNLNNELPIENQLATDKQKNLLKRFKVNFPNDLTKKEASALIEKYK